MKKPNISTGRKFKGRTIIIPVDCLQGALKAGQFVLKHLYTDNDRIILLQVYKIQGAGLFLMRNLSQILKDISLQDLTILKNKLLEEFDISPDKVQKLAIEGDLALTLKRKFDNGENSIVVIGEDTDLLTHEIPHKQIDAIMKGTNIRNIFYIDDNITLIDDFRILNISENPGNVSKILKNYFEKLSKKFSIEIEYTQAKSNNKALMTDKAAHKISTESPDNHLRKTIESILN